MALNKIVQRLFYTYNRSFELLWLVRLVCVRSPDPRDFLFFKDIDKFELNQNLMMEEFITACPRNCYSTCTFRVQVESNTITRILPFPGNKACPEGPCIKGLSYRERSSTEQRLRYALIRNRNGRFERISLSEAFSHIAERLTYIKERYGSGSILWYRGSGNSGLTNEIGYNFWKCFGGVTITYGNLCWPAGLEAVRATLGSVKHNVPWDLLNSKLIVVWGKNPAETNIQEMAFIGMARANGTRIIVIDPRRTPTADKADIFYRPKPGTDGILALAIARVLITEELTDRRFIDSHVKGFEEFAGRNLVSPEDAEAVCGIPSGEIIDLARMIGRSRPVTFIAGYGLQRYTNGGQTIRSILSVAILTGNIGFPGAGFNFANLQSYVFDSPLEPLSYYPDPEKDKPFRRTISMARLGTDMLAAVDPPIKAIWIERGNPILQAPDSSSVAAAFSKSEFTVAVEQFMTDTALKADVVLPAKDIFEQSDITGSYWSPYIQLKPKILEPEGEIMPESDIYYHLAVMLGLEIPPDLVPVPGNENTEAWLERRIAGMTEVTLASLRKGPVIAPGLQEIAYSDYKFNTPSGRIELYCSDLQKNWGISPLPEFQPPFIESDRELPLTFMSPNVSSRIHSQFGNLEVIRSNSEEPALEISPEDAGSRKVSTGDLVRIFNSTGSLLTKARVTNRVPPGVVVLHNGIWFDEGGGSNMLTPGVETDIGYGAAFHGHRVEVIKEEDK